MEQDTLDRLKQKIANYEPSLDTQQIVQMTPKLFMVGISGAGKGTIRDQLLRLGGYHRIVTSTTRQPRSNNGVMEQDGVDYHFLSFAEAERMLDDGEYVEANLYSGNVYGASAAELRAAHDVGKVAIADIEVQGVATYMKLDPQNTHAVFIVPPSYQVWQNRLLGRYKGAIDQADYEKRMATAQTELRHVLSTPYYHFVLNDVLDVAVADTARIASAGRQNDAAEAAGRQMAEEILRQLEHQR